MYLRLDPNIWLWYDWNIPFYNGINHIERDDQCLSCRFDLVTFSTNFVLQVNYGGVATKKSPYRVKVAAPLNPAMVSAFGPGLEKGVKSSIPTHFNVDCREAGPGNLEVSMLTPEGRELPVSLTDNENGTYVVDYVPPQPGNYSVNLNYGNLKVPQCPIKVNVQPSVDVSKVKVDGLKPSEYNIFNCCITLLIKIKCETLSIDLQLNRYLSLINLMRI